MIEIAAVVVLYNPDCSFQVNINSYINACNKIYIIDNSECSNDQYKNKKITYIANKKNLGIAKALNIGINRALDDGYQWVMTFDQDSYACDNMIDEMIKCHKQFKSAALISPFHANKYALKSQTNSDYEEVFMPMTSGNLLNIKAFKGVDGFKEKLFIDYVDNDFCLRLNLKGYKIIQANKAILKHNLGELKRHKLLWKSFYSTNHCALRRYYIFRNRLYLINKYKCNFPSYIKSLKYRFFIDFIIVLLFERDKLNKFKMMIKGISDFKKNRFGALI